MDVPVPGCALIGYTRWKRVRREKLQSRERTKNSSESGLMLGGSFSLMPLLDSEGHPGRALGGFGQSICSAPLGYPTVG